MRQIRPHLLWLGHAGDGRDYSSILEAGIQALVQLSAEEPAVCCGAGLSRSPAIAAAALSMVFQDSPDDCLKKVVEHFPADVAPDLWKEVQDFMEEDWF